MTIDGYAQRMRVLIASAIPHTLLMMSQSVMAGVDSLIVAPLGTLAIAAVGLSSFVTDKCCACSLRLRPEG